MFRTVAPKIAERNGGYTRIIKTGFRPGDAADTALIELVDFNELYNPNAEEKKTTRRSRRSATAKKEAVVAEAPVVEEKLLSLRLKLLILQRKRLKNNIHSDIKRKTVQILNGFRYGIFSFTSSMILLS